MSYNRESYNIQKTKQCNCNWLQLFDSYASSTSSILWYQPISLPWEFGHLSQPLMFRIKFYKQEGYQHKMQRQKRGIFNPTPNVFHYIICVRPLITVIKCEMMNAKGGWWMLWGAGRVLAEYFKWQAVPGPALGLMKRADFGHAAIQGVPDPIMRKLTFIEMVYWRVGIVM